jgi:hypothetical protein
MPEEKEGSFKVSDRRLFNPDGTLREEAAREREASAPAPELSTPPPAGGAGAQSQRAPEPEPAPDFAEGPEGEMTPFMALIMEFATPAFIHLGMAEHPATGKPQVNLPAAQQAIDMLSLLRQKTRGNLTREEEDFFDGLLADLRMQFVSLRR